MIQSRPLSAARSIGSRPSSARRPNSRPGSARNFNRQNSSSSTTRKQSWNESLPVDTKGIDTISSDIFQDCNEAPKIQHPGLLPPPHASLPEIIEESPRARVKLDQGIFEDSLKNGSRKGSFSPTKSPSIPLSGRRPGSASAFRPESRPRSASYRSKNGKLDEDMNESPTIASTKSAEEPDILKNTIPTTNQPLQIEVDENPSLTRNEIPPALVLPTALSLWRDKANRHGSVSIQTQQLSKVERRTLQSEVRKEYIYCLSSTNYVSFFFCVHLFTPPSIRSLTIWINRIPIRSSH